MHVTKVTYVKGIDAFTSAAFQEAQEAAFTSMLSPFDTQEQLVYCGYASTEFNIETILGGKMEEGEESCLKRLRQAFAVC